MEQLRMKSMKAHSDLVAIDKRIWTRTSFVDRSCCDDVTNNVSESFNSYIKDARALPIISMMEAISDKLMERMAQLYHNAMNWTTKFSPNSQARLSRRKDDAAETQLIFYGHFKFKVRDKK